MILDLARLIVTPIMQQAALRMVTRKNNAVVIILGIFASIYFQEAENELGDDALSLTVATHQLFLFDFFAHG